MVTIKRLILEEEHLLSVVRKLGLRFLYRFALLAARAAVLPHAVVFGCRLATSETESAHCLFVVFLYICELSSFGHVDPPIAAGIGRTGRHR